MIKNVPQNTHYACTCCGYATQQPIQNYIRKVEGMPEVGPHTWNSFACPSCDDTITVMQTDPLNCQVEQTTTYKVA